ncbi:hypothetical protein HDU79_002699 [Rhizoclosmatium sp. JEL0117]|nr:hypothetical protein HDU79_002699 [Rhizoclosmatium sp. JEL0117]
MEIGSVKHRHHFCALHLRVIGSFEKAVGFTRMSNLLEYKSLHTNGLGNAEVLETVADAVQLVSGARGIGEVLEIAMDSVSSFSIEGLFGNQPSALIGIGSERYTYTPVGMPLASPASAVASYVIYKSMPIFREKGFVLERLGNPSLPTLLTIDGFLHTPQDSQIWSKLVDNAFPGHTWISLQWDASTTLNDPSFLDITSLLTNPVEKIPGMFVTAGMSGLAAFQGARGNCERTAYLVADAIMRLGGGQRVVLMGHSLGACLVYHVLSVISESMRIERGKRRDSKVEFGEDEGSVRERKIESAILLGSACPYKRIGDDGRDGWVDASEAVSRNIINLFSVKDEVLNALGKTNGVACAGARAIEWNRMSNGRSTKREKIINVQCDEVCGHFDWKPSVASARLFAC